MTQEVITQRCPHCRSLDIRKNGHNPKGKQQYCYWGWRRCELVRLKRRTAKRRLRRALMEVEPRQQIYDRLPFDIREVNLRTDPLFAETTRSIIDEEVRTPLHLDKPPLFRMTLIRQPEARNVLVVVMHHIISDGWSRNLFYQELSLLYRAFQHHMPNPLKPLRIQYKDYAVW